MDYEKAYKAVLKTATQWIKDGCTDKEKICLECVFPELRESECDVAIAELINYHRRWASMLEDGDTNIHARWVRYLEKQKESLHISESCKDNADSFTSEDERIRKKLYHTVMGTPNDSTWFDGTSKEDMLAWLEKQKEQKPVAWSEEDEDRIRQIERIAQQAGCTQKLQEEIHDWLKSLRPSWKPTEEQMNALNFAIIYMFSTKANPTVLRDLYDDLLKLKDQ